jgi:hypothetical protein
MAAMPGNHMWTLHASIGDAVLETAMTLIDQLNTHNDRYIAMELIAFLSLATQHHRHIITIP